MHDDGVIKFQCDWEPSDPIAWDAVPELLDLMEWRDRLFQWGAIGVYPNGVGYGNVSVRLAGDRFLISGTQTGHLATTGPEHYTLVDRWTIDRNWLHCVGPLRASSESLTHAAIYQHDQTIGAIVHAHHRDLWQRHQHQLPTTRAEVPYGTPAMAREMWRLFRETNLTDERILVMAGHEEGLLSFGRNLAVAAQPFNHLLSLLN
jgi:ribulose-5-phosphate 4-epimerase/fuculose-1-phosphate aldolase